MKEFDSFACAYPEVNDKMHKKASITAPTSRFLCLHKIYGAVWSKLQFYSIELL
jgi:hypothetical protein